MNGPEHYQRAEQLLTDADNAVSDGYSEYLVAQAQVHATLALAAATAQAGRLVHGENEWARTLDGGPR